MKNIFHYIFRLIVESALTQIYVNVLQSQARETPLVFCLITVLWFPFEKESKCWAAHIYIRQIQPPRIFMKNKYF